MKKCKFFRCVNREDCSEKDCPGCGGVAFQNCGCDACINKTMLGDVEICEVALDMREADMEEV